MQTVGTIGFKFIIIVSRKSILHSPSLSENTIIEIMCNINSWEHPPAKAYAGSRMDPFMRTMHKDECVDTQVYSAQMSLRAHLEANYAFSKFSSRDVTESRYMLFFHKQTSALFFTCMSALKDNPFRACLAYNLKSVEYFDFKGS